MYTYRAKLIRVIDGDTIVCQIDLGLHTCIQSVIRLYGINAPETRTKNLKEKTRGLLAKQWLIERLSPLAYFIIKTRKDKKGSFGRYLGIVIDPNADQSINDEMIDKKLAQPYIP